MTTLTLELSPTTYERLHALAARQGKPVESLVGEWIAERSAPAPPDAPAPAPPGDRERNIAALRAAGLLVEPGPELRARAARSSATLEQVRAALDRAGGTPLSEVILEMRGPKE